MSGARKASHAGSWYSSRSGELDGQLQRWLDAVSPSPDLVPARGIIAPHAGYSYSGATAAHAFKYLDPSRVKRVFILGPSHHYYLKGCAVTGYASYETPLMDLPVDLAVVKELRATGSFEVMSATADDDEHSLEMQCPYIAKMMGQGGAGGKRVTIVPVLVGDLSPEKERFYGSIFARYLADPTNFFVISSDFCHWGERFRYTYYDPSQGKISESIENLDKEGMACIETLSPEKYLSYQQKYQNTICGRHAISTLLHALSLAPVPSAKAGVPWAIQFVHYSQSSPCVRPTDSSVSYASAVLSPAQAA